MNKSKAVQACSISTGRSPRIIYKLAREQEQGTLKRPKHTRRPHIKRHSRIMKYKSDLRSSIRRIVHSCLAQSVPPILSTILDTLNALKQFPPFKKGTLYNLLKDIGFKYERRGNAGVFVENEDIIGYRHTFLEKIKEARKQKKTIIYTGELWVDTRKISQQKKENDEDENEPNFDSEVKPVFVLVHAGTINGFIEGAKLTLMYRAAKTDGYKDMDCETYENWFFNDLIPICPSGSSIVMDEAKYNSRKIENIPNIVWPKDEIIQWLENEGMEMSPNLTTLELLELVNSVKDDCGGCKFIDSECEKLGIEILRLPKYHCELNPIYMVWNQVEDFIKTNICSFKKEDLLELINESYNCVTSEDWQHYLAEVETNEDFLWQADSLQQNVNALIKKVHFNPTPLDDMTNTDLK